MGSAEARPNPQSLMNYCIIAACNTVFRVSYAVFFQLSLFTSVRLFAITPKLFNKAQKLRKEKLVGVIFNKSRLSTCTYIICRRQALTVALPLWDLK